MSASAEGDESAAESAAESAIVANEITAVLRGISYDGGGTKGASSAKSVDTDLKDVGRKLVRVKGRAVLCCVCVWFVSFVAVVR